MEKNDKFCQPPKKKFNGGPKIKLGVDFSLTKIASAAPNLSECVYDPCMCISDPWCHIKLFLNIKRFGQKFLSKQLLFDWLNIKIFDIPVDQNF